MVLAVVIRMAELCSKYSYLPVNNIIVIIQGMSSERKQRNCHIPLPSRSVITSEVVKKKERKKDIYSWQSQ